MSIFNTILQKLGIQKAETPAPKVAPNLTGAAKGFVPPTKMDPNAPNRPMPGQMPPGMKPAEMPMVDVTAKLDAMAKASPVQLDWRVSINDLMALLGMGHKPEDIKELAIELGCPESELGDSYKRNVWTHKALMQKIAENGGKLPQNLLK